MIESLHVSGVTGHIIRFTYNAPVLIAEKNRAVMRVLSFGFGLYGVPRAATRPRKYQ